MSSLPIEEDLEFERAEWRVARAMWYVTLAVMGAALLGVFGKGPLSAAEVADPADTLRARYERFGRLGSAMRTTVFLQALPDGTGSFSLDRAYLDAIRIVAVTPEPDTTTVTAGGIRYEFTSLRARAAITVDFEPRRPWRVRGTLGRHEAAVSLSHFIYP